MAENEFEKKEGSKIAETTSTDVNLETTFININNITGPLVVFFGPRNIGKTVALLRLCNYLDKYDITVDEGFRSDTAVYKTTIDAFNKLRNDTSFAPDATGTVNFLLLNVSHNGDKVCQILEAPGEHFFDKDNPEEMYPPYLNKIFAESYRKVYVFFFALNMFNLDGDRRKYATRISQFINGRVDPHRDKIILVCTKCNESMRYMRNGRPVKENYKNDLYSKPGFETIKDTVRNSGFKLAPFVPFSSGDFNSDGVSGRKIFTLSPDFYPRDLWKHIHSSLTGESSWFSDFLMKLFR